MSWDPYLDLDHGLLRNLLGITDAAELASVEAELTATRIVDLQRIDLPGGYDLDHLQEFHEYLFGDVYDWAGELRTVAIGKGVAFCRPERLRADGGRIFARLAEAGYLRGLDRAAFVDALTVLFAEIDGPHPPRSRPTAHNSRSRARVADPAREATRAGRTGRARAHELSAAGARPRGQVVASLRKSQLVIFSGTSLSQAWRPSWYIVPPV